MSPRKTEREREGEKERESIFNCSSIVVGRMRDQEGSRRIWIGKEIKCSTCKDHRNTHENTRLMPDTWIVFSHTEPVYNTYLSTNLGYLRRGSSWQHGGSTCSNPSSCLFAAPAGRIFAFDPLRHFLPILFSSLEEPSFFSSFLSLFGFHASSTTAVEGMIAGSLLWFHSGFADVRTYVWYNDVQRV